MNKYIAKDGDRLDTIVFQHYGTIDMVEIVLFENPHLLDKMILSARDEVFLPLQIDKKVVLRDKVLW